MRIEQAKIQAKPPPKEFQLNRQDWQPSGNKKRSNQSFQAGQGQNKRFMSGQQSGQLDERQWLEYGKCGKKHPGECRAGTMGCYKCGK